MSNKEQLLTLVRKRYAETVAWNAHLAELYSRMEAHAAKKKSREYKQLLDQAEAELAAGERSTQEYARQSQPLSLSIDEFSNEEQEEITALLQSGVELVRRLCEKFEQVRQVEKTGSDEEEHDTSGGPAICHARKREEVLEEEFEKQDYTQVVGRGAMFEKFHRQTR